jgi:putative addiction module killer protein
MTAAIQVVEYLDARGRSPYAVWFNSLNAEAAAKVTAAFYRLEAGKFSNVKGVGLGVFERRLDFGPGYRIYFGKDGNLLVVLLGGSSKRRQNEAITAAQERWADYKRRKSELQGGH